MPTWKPDRISAVLIAKDEEKVLGRCLESLAGVDEICVLDTGSSDGTLGVAGRAGAKVGHQTFTPFDFSAARNRADEMSTGDWILTIDADEVLAPGAMDALREGVRALKRLKRPVNGFRVSFRLFGEAEDVAPSEIPKLKLYRRGAFRWQYRVHEQLVPTEAGAILALPEAVIEHRPLPGREHRRRQNTELLKLSVDENPEYARNLRQLGMEHFLAGEWKEAVRRLSSFLPMQWDPTDASEVAVKIAQAHGKLGDDTEAYAMFARSAMLAPFRREPLWHQAVWLIGQARLDEAVVVLERCLAIPESSKPAYFLNLEAVWDGSLPKEALDLCRAEIGKAKALAGRRA